jgi:arsenate reductase
MNDQAKEKVLFICNQNSGRSQMAEALLRMLYGNRYESYSAGVVPSQVNPYAIKAMEQLGVDMSGHRSKSIDAWKDTEFDYVVTVCDTARETCPFFPGRQVLHHSFSSAMSQGSEEEILASTCRVRDEIRAWIEQQFGAQSK